jgi:hypothetical protein
MSGGKHVPDSLFSHPHRQFQHLTPIRADWHPTVPNVFSIGRYPAAETPEDRRTIDVYSYTPGGRDGGVSLLSRIEDPRVGGIQCVSMLVILCFGMQPNLSACSLRNSITLEIF